MTENKNVILSAKDVVVEFDVRDRVLTAIRSVSLDLIEGEVLAIVGESGSGKSVLTKTFTGMLEENGRVASGSITYRGQELTAIKKHEDWEKIRGAKIATIFQDPMTSLNPLVTIGRQISEVIVKHQGKSASEAKEMAINYMERVGIPEAKKRFNEYPFQYSGGMRQRVVIAIALAANPRLIIADEPTTALDVTVQAQILKLMENLVKKFGSALILVTHDLAVVSEMTHRVVVMYCGKIVEEAPTAELIRAPRHPYTKGLLGSIPRITGVRTPRLPQIPGMAPHLFDLPKGCSFAPRCGYATERCREEVPAMRELSAGRRAACHNPVSTEERMAGNG